jgi:hypothetical protein
MTEIRRRCVAVPAEWAERNRASSSEDAGNTGLSWAVHQSSNKID